MINKQNIASFLLGAGLASLAYYFKNKSTKKIDISNDYQTPEYQHLKQQQLARVIKYFGEQKFKIMENSFVIVFGVGGVGSHVVNMLARSGVQRIRIVDFDRVSLSSLNRHSFALRKDVGKSKVLCLKDYISQILPHIKIETVQQYVTPQNAKQLIDPTANYIIDCIDNLDAKVELIALCKQMNIKLITSGGAGMKCDPTKLQIRDISDCKYDNLIMRLKRQLTKKGIKNGVKVAFSYQQADKQLLPLNQIQQKQPQSFKVFDNYRIRIVPVLGTMPAILGMAIASYVLCDLAGEPYKPFQTDYVKSNAVAKLYNQLLYDEKKRANEGNNLQIDMQQTAILAKQIFKWKSGVSDKKQSGMRLARWDCKKAATIDNLILLTKDQYEKHNKYNSINESPYSEQVKQKFRVNSLKAKQLYDSGYMIFI